MQWELVEPSTTTASTRGSLPPTAPVYITSAWSVGSYEATISELSGRGHEVLLGGEYNGVNFAYLSTDVTSA